jgi:tetratricopeptide (TPR) repeat protein
VNDREGLGLAYNIAGVLHEAVSDYAHALADYQASLVIHEAIGDREGLRAALYNLGRFYEDAVYRPELARRCYRRAITLLEESRAGLERSVHRLTYLSDKLSLYRRMVLLERQAGNNVAAWETAERMRSRHLVDVLATVPLSPPTAVPSHMRLRENQLLARLRQLLHARLDGEAGESLVLTNKIGRVEAELTALWQEMEAVAPDYVDLRWGRPLVWKKTQQLLVG